MRLLIGVTAAITMVIAGLVLVLVIRGRAPGLSLPKLAAVDPANVVSLLVNLVMLLIALVALYVSAVTLQQSVTSGAEQQETLDASRDALAGVLETARQQQAALEASRQALESVRETVRQQQETMTGMLATARSQYQLIEAQTQRELERLARRPSVTISIDDTQLVAGGPAVTVAPLRAARDTWARKTFMIRNTGTAPLLKPIVLAEAQPNTVRVRTRTGTNLAPNTVQSPMALDLQPYADLGLNYTFFLEIQVPPVAQPTTVSFSLVGDNMRVASVSIRFLLEPTAP